MANASVNDDAKVLDLWDLDTEKRRKYQELKDLVRDITHYKNEPDQLVRFLRARAWDVKAAETMFRKMVAWRAEVGADTILNEWAVPTFLDAYFPSRVLAGLDRDGDPVIVERMGQVDMYGLLREYGSAVMLKHAVWIREHLFNEATERWVRSAHEASHTGRRLTIIADLEGLTLSQVASSEVLKVIQKTLELDQANYPESAKKLILLNAPWVFRQVWALVKGWLDEGVQAKMVVIPPGSKQRDALAEYVALENLPPVLGGSSADHIPAGGPVPKGAAST